jgi:hypothetical protein
MAAWRSFWEPVRQYIETVFSELAKLFSRRSMRSHREVSS